MSISASRRSSSRSQSVAPAAAIFKTEMGWSALVWQSQRLSRVAFGQTGFAEVATKLPEDAEILDTLAPWQEVVVDQVMAYTAGEQVDFLTVDLDDLHLTEFQAAVIWHCRNIPWGQTVSYMQLAEQAGSPRAARAVGNVMRSNPWPLIVPCHRVVASQGLGGYSARGGLDTKRRLLRQEGVL